MGEAEGEVMAEGEVAEAERQEEGKWEKAAEGECGGG